MSSLSNQLVLDLLQNKRYGVEYQPIVCVLTGEIIAYEALSRFYTATGESLRPDLVYASLHHNLLSLYQVEYEQKKIQLEHAPLDKTIFVNLDQDAFFASGVTGIDNPFVQLIRSHKQNQVMVELIENSELNDALMSLSMIETLAAYDIGTAIDDLCNPKSMISVSVMQLVDVIKLDKHVVKKADDERFMLFTKKMIEFGRQSDKKIVLEGIETESDLDFARELGVDYVQGYLYRSQFIQRP
ncbi:MAG: EAL domain-containing protein [Marinomonas sp.]|jgi:EAL domain-containing protein (putative c-di-GMP-specific phosphodiesterase class I)|uniref:EAL domain-containing protein n=1 Tax=unclassified Marinomonas TaxID=196814 RepID=UPI0005FA48C5|nr:MULTISPECIES: EAL domain-containing protein [unclassified Marinomonas]KJZ13924.1 signal peptide protein [Marinomonas sp. S3726]KZM45100.1 signal peptide protein [Marinomonas sp. SBI22]KZM46798.1 signal peptide protein [Marinomonas sp. SBI8L]